jgi:CHAD domain-containing protein
MALDPKSVNKPFRKLRKLLKNFPDPPDPGDVHDLRTHTRRIDAMTGAFQLVTKKAGKELVKNLKPIRKAAGDVRDMDVLTDIAASLDPNGNGDCRLKLMQYLAERRTRSATKLVKKVKINQKRLRADLKECATNAERGIVSAKSKGAKQKDNRKSRRKPASSMAASLQIEQELREWPRLSQKNIHPFRIQVKELRYVLQLAEDSDSKLIDALGEVKDQIGLWHDWNELATIAGQVLDHGAACSITAQIQTRAKHELERAFARANAFRAQYLPSEGSFASKKSRKKVAASEIHPGGHRSHLAARELTPSFFS